MNLKLTEKQNKYALIIVRLLTVITAVSFAVLTVLQVFFVKGVVYDSDWIGHLDFVRYSDSSGTYSLFHLILSLVYTVSNNIDLMSIVAVTIVVLSNVASFILVRKYLLKRIDNKSLWFVELLSLATFILSMIVIIYPGINWYLGRGTPNPWHNPTYPLARPFAIGSFILISEINDRIEKGEKFTKPLIGFCATMFVSVLMKPSFFFVFVPALVCYYLYKLIKSKFKLFSKCFFLGLSVVPAGLALIVQNLILFNEENKIIFSFSGELWRSFALKGSVLLCILLAAAFPLFVLLTNMRKLNFEQVVALLIFVFGVLEAYFLAESGPRQFHLNFFWGYYYGLFFIFLVSVQFFFKEKLPNLIKYPGLALFLLHLVSGALYYVKILFGYTYY